MAASSLVHPSDFERGMAVGGSSSWDLSVQQSLRAKHPVSGSYLTDGDLMLIEISEEKDGPGKQQ